MNHPPRWSAAFALILSVACTPAASGRDRGGTSDGGEGGGAEPGGAGSGGGGSGGSAGRGGGEGGSAGNPIDADAAIDSSAPDTATSDAAPSADMAPPRDAAPAPDGPSSKGAVSCTRRVRASSIAELTAAIGGAMPGDCVVLANGNYTVAAPIVVNRVGTANQRITVMAETVGGATLAGDAGLTVNAPAAFVTIHGFRITNQGGLVAGANTQNILFTRNALEVPGNGNYMVVSGTDNEVSFNAFTNKSTNGAMLILDEDTKGSTRPFVHDNHFFSHTFTGTNGGEAVRVFSILPRVEHNLFEEIRVHGEMISVKEGGGSRGGFYRFNTFRNCANGTLTLRYARNDVVEGNFFFNTPGIRAYGTNHKIINNYLEGGNIILGDGTVAVGYVGIDNVEVSFNTLIDAHITGQSRPDGVAPKNLRIANNIVVGTSGMAFAQPSPFVNATFAGNIVWGGVSAGDLPASGFRAVDPQLQMDGTGRYHLGASSPAINAAVGMAPVPEDIEGQARQQPDVGADELSAGPVLRRPLTARDVGPNAP
jgi:poly(beta-D-mannuronate) lyase